MTITLKFEVGIESALLVHALKEEREMLEKLSKLGRDAILELKIVDHLIQNIEREISRATDNKINVGDLLSWAGSLLSQGKKNSNYDHEVGDLSSEDNKHKVTATNSDYDYED